MTETEAKNRTGLLTSRHYPAASIPFLQCQLGDIIMVQRNRNPDRNCNGYSMTVPIFQVKGFGSTWEAAVARYNGERKRSQKRQAKGIIG